MNTIIKEKLKKEKLDPLLLRVAIILVIGYLAPLLDSTMINVAFKTITEDMKTTISVAQWITTGYVLAMGMAVPLSGWASRRFGCKRIYIFSLLVFLTGSALAILSWSIESLICFTIIQGIGAGLMGTTGMTEIVQMSGGRNLGRILSIISIPVILGPILGPVLGGIIVSGLSWRAIFYVNIQVCLVAILLSLRYIPKDEISGNRPSLDIFGLLMLSPAFAFIVYGIVQVASHGGFGSIAVIVPMGIGIALMVLFIIYALKTKRVPVLDLRLFKSNNFSAANIALFLTGIVVNGAMLLLPLYYQSVSGYSILSAGLCLIPQGVGMLIIIGWVGKKADKDSARITLLISFVVTALGTLPFALADADTSPLFLAAALLVRGVGLGALQIFLLSFVYIGLEREQIPHATTATRIVQTIGGAFGSAILATVLQHQIAGYSQHDLHKISGVFNVAFWWVFTFTALAIIPTLFLQKRTKKIAEPLQQGANK